MAVKKTADKVIAIAEAEVGYLEKSRDAYLSDPKVLNYKTEGAGYDNYTKYGRDMHKVYPSVMDFPAAWCDCFVDWCFYMAYGIATAKSLLCGNFDDYTVSSAQMYKNKGAWYTNRPRIGDQIFFVSSGKSKDISNICHTGLVYAVDSSYVYTIEGNTSSTSGVVANGGTVAKKKYALNYERIAGYGRPKYDTGAKTSYVPKETIVKTSPQKDIEWLQTQLNACLNGKYKSQLSGGKLIVDGVFGSQTSLALYMYWQQLCWSIPNKGSDGVYHAGSKTIEALSKGKKQ